MNNKIVFYRSLVIAGLLTPLFMAIVFKEIKTAFDFITLWFETQAALTFLLLYAIANFPKRKRRDASGSISRQ